MPCPKHDIPVRTLLVRCLVMKEGIVAMGKSDPRQLRKKKFVKAVRAQLMTITENLERIGV